MEITWKWVEWRNIDKWRKGVDIWREIKRSCREWILWFFSTDECITYLYHFCNSFWAGSGWGTLINYHLTWKVNVSPMAVCLKAGTLYPRVVCSTLFPHIPEAGNDAHDSLLFSGSLLSHFFSSTLFRSSGRCWKEEPWQNQTLNIHNLAFGQACCFHVRAKIKPKLD